jgi:excisionase family DNA binding protein
MNEILTIQEVSDYLRLSRTTVWRWCNEGKLSAFKVGRGWRVRQCDVAKLISQPMYSHSNGCGDDAQLGRDTENSRGKLESGARRAP